MDSWLPVWVKSELMSYRIGFSKNLLTSSGLLVGIGTYFSKGCTSGHGVCGIARFSKRSIIATLTFIGSAMVVVFINANWMGV